MEILEVENTMELLKIIHNMSYDEFGIALGISDRVKAGDEYWFEKIGAIKKNLFIGLCELDSFNQVRLFTYAQKKNDEFQRKMHEKTKSW